MSGILITARKPGDGDEAIPEDLHLGANVKAEGCQLLRRERMPNQWEQSIRGVLTNGKRVLPVAKRAAEIVLLVVIMAPGPKTLID